MQPDNICNVAGGQQLAVLAQLSDHLKLQYDAAAPESNSSSGMPLKQSLTSKIVTGLAVGAGGVLGQTILQCTAIIALHSLPSLSSQT